MLAKMQNGLKESSLNLGLLALKSATGLFIGLTFALIFRQLMDVGSFLFTFIIVLFGVGFLKLSQKWRYTGVFIFNLFCIMTAMLLRMYILLAPGE